MQFGFTLKPDHSIERTLALTRQAEAAGLRLRLAVRLARPVARSLSPADADGRARRAAAARDLRDQPGDARAVGHRVARWPSLDELSAAGGWTSASAAATRRGACWASRRRRWPTSRRRSHVIRDLVEGRAGRRTRAPSSSCPGRAAGRCPVWVAGYGPMALAMTGRIADGVILQLGRPRPDPLVRRARSARPPPAAGRDAGRGPGPWRPRRPTSATAPTAASGRAGSRRSSATTSSTSSTSTRASSCPSR